MAKNKAKTVPQNTLLARLNNKNIKLIAMIICALLILVGVLYFSSARQSANKRTSSQDATNATTDAKELLDTGISLGATPTPDAGSSGSGAAASPQASAETSASGGGGAAASSGSTAVATAAPAPGVVVTPEPFEVGPPYIEVDDNYACGGGSHPFVFTGYITANGPGTVTYNWSRSDGATTGSYQMVFTGAGTQQVENTWTLVGSADYYGWMRLDITSPFETSSKPDDGDFNLVSVCP